MTKAALLLLLAISACRAPIPPMATPTKQVEISRRPADPIKQVEIYRRREDLPESMRSSYEASFFADRMLIRLDVEVGCHTPTAIECKNFGWPEYAARCRSGSGVEHPVLAFAKLEDVRVWPDGYVSKPGETPAFSWTIAYDERGFDVPPILCPSVFRDVYWFAVPQANGPIEASPRTYGSDLCTCLDE